MTFEGKLRVGRGGRQSRSRRRRCSTHVMELNILFHFRLSDATENDAELDKRAPFRPVHLTTPGVLLVVRRPILHDSSHVWLA